VTVVERKKQSTGGGPAQPDAVESLLDGIIKDHGKESAQLIGAGGPAVQVRGVLSTGNLVLDHAIGVWGVPYGRLSMIYGPEAGGKTTIALQLAAEAQRKKGAVLYMDMEHKLDLGYAQKLGVDTDRIIISQPPYMEKCMAVIETAIKIHQKVKDVPLLIVFDSLNAASTKAELEGDYEQKHYAPGAGVMSQTLKRIIPLVATSNTVLLFISQVRQKIGVQFGNDKDTACGNAPKFYASVVIEVYRKGMLKESDASDAKVIGNKVGAYIAKNQVAPPFSRVEFQILYGSGTDNVRSAIDLGKQLGIIQQSGSWFSMGEKGKWNGEKGFRTWAAENPKMFDAILGKIKQRAQQR
jgi:recombination protein RecA